MTPGRPALPVEEILVKLDRMFKADVRKLKALGLTESLEVGYRLTPLGAEVASTS